MPCALSPAIDSSIVVSALSAPSVDEHEAGDRQAAQLVARAIERVAQPRARALERQVGRRLQPLGRRREPEDAQVEPLAERREQRRVGAAELVRDEVAARLAVLSATCMLRESSSRMPTKFCCGTATLSSSIGRSSANSATSKQRDADGEQHDAIAAAERAPAAGTSRARTAPPRPPRRRPSATSTGWPQARTGPARRPAVRT